MLKALGLVHAADEDAVFDEQVRDFFLRDECAGVAMQSASIVKAAADLPYTRTSRSGPVPESNFAAIFSLMLKRSQWTPAERRMVV